MAKIVDDNIQKLKKGMQDLKRDIERAQAISACQNLMSKYQYYHMKNQRTEETMLFALKSPGAAVEMYWGIYDEPEGVLRWKRDEGYEKPRKAGGLALHCMTTPIIEVAKDGESAKGVWLLLGAEAGKGRMEWAMGPFAMDFIKEDGEWKIWKYCTMGVIRSAFEKGWHKENGRPAEAFRERPPEYRPDRPGSYGNYVWKPDKLMPLVPPVPLPYETWDDSWACIPIPGNKWDTTGHQVKE